MRAEILPHGSCSLPSDDVFISCSSRASYCMWKRVVRVVVSVHVTKDMKCEK